jgi:uncharacterized protein YbgA (DUF1722 family)
MWLSDRAPAQKGKVPGTSSNPSITRKKQNVYMRNQPHLKKQLRRLTKYSFYNRINLNRRGNQDKRKMKEG